MASVRVLDGLSDEDAVAKLGDDAANLVGPSLLDQLGRRPSAEQLLAGEQPEPRLLRLVEVGQLVNEVFQLEQGPLRIRLRKRLALIPARNGLGTQPSTLATSMLFIPPLARIDSSFLATALLMVLRRRTVGRR
jgi:hypothetical protein